MAKYVYIDESGDLGKFGSKYFTVAAVVVEEPRLLTRIIKRVRQRRLKKSIKNLPEIKANNSNKIIRHYVLNKLKKINCSIFSVAVPKEKIADYLFEVKEKLYNYLCGILLEKVHTGQSKLIIVVDKKHTNTLVREDFNNYVKSKLKGRLCGAELEVYHTLSYASSELQVVDFVAWSINRKFNSGDDSYYKIIEEKIINKENLVLWK